jgi:cytochrome c
MSWRGWLVLGLVLCAGCAEPLPESAPPGAGAAAQDAILGERAYMRCRACHSLGAGESHKVGPNLHGFMGRPAGTAEGYTYSEELVAAGLNWDAGTLAAWITDPAFTVPGTTMVYPNDLAGAEMVALIAYLEAETSN